MRSLSAVILEVVANPRAVMFEVDTSRLESMSWSELEMVNSIARTCHPAIIIIDDIHVASDPVP